MHILIYYASVFTSYCCYNKLVQVQWIKTTQIYYLRVVEVRRMKHWTKIKVSAGWFLSRSSTGDSVPFSSFQGQLHSLTHSLLRLQSQQWQVESLADSITLILMLILLLPLLLIKDPYAYINWAQPGNEENLSILRSVIDNPNSPLLYSNIVTGFGIMIWTFLGALALLTTRSFHIFFSNL